MIVVCQLSLLPIKAPVPSCSSNVGSSNGLGTPYWLSSGPMARIITLFGVVPCTMNPPIITLSPVCTKERVEMLPSRAIAAGVGVAVGVAVAVVVGVAVCIALAVAVAVAVTVGVALTVDVGVAVAVGVGLGVGPDCAQYLPPPLSPPP